MDEWAYYVHEQAAQAKQPEENIVHSTAIVLDLPEADPGRPRANSLGQFTPPKSPLEWPLSRKERQSLYNPHNWSLKQQNFTQDSSSLAMDLGVAFLGNVAQSAATLAEDLATTEQSLALTLDKLDALVYKSTTHAEKVTQLDTLALGISQALKVYDDLEEATRQLNKPGLRLVTSKKFPELLHNLNAGLEFCQQHPDFKDMDLYALRFTQCLSRAHGMLLEYCTSIWRQAESEVSRQLVGASAVTKDALLWPKFAAECARAKPLVTAVDQDSQVLVEIRASYANVRTQLLGAHVRSLNSKEFSSTLGKLKDLLHKELDLWVATFGTQHGFAEFELMLSEPIYIEIRGSIVRQDSLSTLSEIIMLLQDEGSPLFQQISKDTQNRLLFRADQQVEKLLNTRISAREIREESFVFAGQILTVLNTVQSAMTPAIFSNFAHQTVRAALQALASAAYPSLAPIESLVFQIKQLVTLQNGLRGFELGQATTPHVDFSGLKQLLTGWTLSNMPQMLPQVTHERYDSLQDVYTELQRVVKLYTEQSSAKALAPLEARSARAAEQETRALRSQLPSTIEKLRATTERHIKDGKVVQALMDATTETLRSDYADYFAQIHATGTPDELQGVPDPDAFGVYLTSI